MSYTRVCTGIAVRLSFQFMAYTGLLDGHLQWLLAWTIIAITRLGPESTVHFVYNARNCSQTGCLILHAQLQPYFSSHRSVVLLGNLYSQSPQPTNERCVVLVEGTSSSKWKIIGVTFVKLIAASPHHTSCLSTNPSSSSKQPSRIRHSFLVYHFVAMVAAATPPTEHKPCSFDSLLFAQWK